MIERVELDRLADYAAGLLDGTPDAVEVAQLIATDTAWGRAYAELTEADRRVRADLDAVRATAEPMPVEVVTQLDAALQEARRGNERAGGRTVVSLAEARRRKRRWTAVSAVAAAVVAFAVFVVPALRGVIGGDPGVTTFAGSDAGEPQRSVAGAPDVPAPASTNVLVRFSGVDYSRETLRMLEASKASADSADLGAESSDMRLRVPDELRRLGDPPARDACLAAIAMAFAGRPLSVDYARFEGVPALVVLLVDTGSTPSRVVVAGAACGLPASGADVRYTSTLG